jgi:hypothetical protein
MPRLFWFHAFNRKTDGDVIDVLLNGPRIHPDPNSETRQNELRLGINPHRVYAYLGRTHTQFGESALALHPAGVGNEISPFDTGGLINKIAPVKAYSDAGKQKYLRSYTWPANQHEAVLKIFPSSDPKRFSEYLLGAAPTGFDGPHDLWNGREIAAIWTSNTDWRAWTWEGRAEAFDLSKLYKWTCSPAKFPELVEHIETVASVNTADAFSTIMGNYVHGGVSHLITSLRGEQAA